MMMVLFCFRVVRFDFNKILNAFTDLILQNIDDTKTDVLELTPLVQWKILLLYLYSESNYWIQYLFKFIMFKRLLFTLRKITNYSVLVIKKSVDFCAFCSKAEMIQRSQSLWFISSSQHNKQKQLIWSIDHWHWVAYICFSIYIAN